MTASKRKKAPAPVLPEDVAGALAQVSTGDFHLARVGSTHGVVESAHGALLFIRGAAALPIIL